MLDRRQLLSSSIGLSAGIAATAAATSQSAARPTMEHDFLAPQSTRAPFTNPIQALDLQQEINNAAAKREIFSLPAGTYTTGPLTLPANAHISGVPGETFIEFKGGACLSAENASNIRLNGLVIDGKGLPLANKGGAAALLSLINVDQCHIENCRFQNSGHTAIALRGSSGKIANNEIMIAAKTGIFSLDATGLDISQNHIHDCGNNGIQVWRSKKGDDGTIISLNRIERIRADDGGSGQNGNGVNIYRAGSVNIAHNVIRDCAFSAIRSNAGSNCQMIGNNCANLGEVALYAEFEFEGALIANNIIDKAASGISITNFNKGGRLAVIQGNLIRNLFTRDHYDARGVGISAEADTLITGNTIENAPTAGIILGWGKFRRDVTASNNLIRNAGIGIGVSSSEEAGSAAAMSNMISGTKDGAIRAMEFSQPIGQDLSGAENFVTTNLTLTGNVAV